MEQQMSRKNIVNQYINFENKDNLCWLHATLALIVHSKTFKKFSEDFPESEINKIISSYNEANGMFNDSKSQLEHCKTLLKNIQQRASEKLQPVMKVIKKEPESSFCALLSLITFDASKIKENALVKFFWAKKCPKCGTSNSSLMCKPIITLANAKQFDPKCPAVDYTCQCESLNVMNLIYKEIPPCLIFHFEKGIRSKLHTSFTVVDHKYQLTGIIILKKKPNHFVTYIRHPISKFWMTYDDTKSAITEFIEAKPEFDLRDLYLVMFESANSNRIVTDAKIDNVDYQTEVINLSDNSND